MSPNHLAERECHRAQALADALADVRRKFAELEALQRAMVRDGIEPRHVLHLEGRELLEKWLAYHARRADWRLRYAGPSGRRQQISEAKRRARLLHDAL